MKKNQLTEQEIDDLLAKVQVGHIGTHHSNGYPYIVPVHFFHEKGKIFVHGLIKGQKIENIKANPKICFEVEQMDGLILDDKACDVNTKYQSVVIFGKASLIDDINQKSKILQKIIGKYTPQLKGQEFPQEMLDGTGIISIDIEEITGKFYG